jgi:hypothetical protein
MKKAKGLYTKEKKHEFTLFPPVTVPLGSLVPEPKAEGGKARVVTVLDLVSQVRDGSGKPRGVGILE